jgi:hypothetical protein
VIPVVGDLHVDRVGVGVNFPQIFGAVPRFVFRARQQQRGDAVTGRDVVLDPVGGVVPPAGQVELSPGFGAANA